MQEVCGMFRLFNIHICHKIKSILVVHGKASNDMEVGLVSHKHKAIGLISTKSPCT